MVATVKLYIPDQIYVALVEEAQRLGITPYKHIINILRNHCDHITQQTIPPEELPAYQVSPNAKVQWNSCKYHARVEGGWMHCYKHRKNLSTILSECQDCADFEPKT